MTLMTLCLVAFISKIPNLAERRFCKYDCSFYFASSLLNFGAVYVGFNLVFFRLLNLRFVLLFVALLWYSVSLKVLLISSCMQKPVVSKYAFMVIAKPLR